MRSEGDGQEKNSQDDRESFLNWKRQYDSNSDAWAECKHGGWRFWLVQELSPELDRELRLFAAWCAREAWSLVPSDCPHRDLVELSSTLISLSEAAAGHTDRVSQLAELSQELENRKRDAPRHDWTGGTVFNFAAVTATDAAREDAARAAYYSAEHLALVAGAAAGTEYANRAAVRAIWAMTFHAEADQRKFDTFADAEAAARFVGHAASSRGARIQVNAGDGSGWTAYGAWIRGGSENYFGSKTPGCYAAWYDTEGEMRRRIADRLAEFITRDR